MHGIAKCVSHSNLAVVIPISPYPLLPYVHVAGADILAVYCLLVQVDWRLMNKRLRFTAGRHAKKR